GFADDIVAIKNRASFPAGELHDGPFADSLVGHLTGEAAAQVVEGSVGLQDFDLRLEFRADLDGSDIAGEASFITGGLPGLAEFANSGKDGGVDGVLWFQTLKKALHFGTHGNDAARSVFVFPDIDADLSRFQVDVPPFEAFDFFESPAGEESEPYHLRQRRGEVAGETGDFLTGEEAARDFIFTGHGNEGFLEDAAFANSQIERVPHGFHLPVDAAVGSTFFAAVEDVLLNLFRRDVARTAVAEDGK